MRNAALALALIATLTGCATVARHPALASAGLIVGAALIAGAQHSDHAQPAQPSQRIPAQPCADCTR